MLIDGVRGGRARGGRERPGHSTLYIITVMLSINAVNLCAITLL